VPVPAAAWPGVPGAPAAASDPPDVAGGTAGGSRWAPGGQTPFAGVARDVQQRQHGLHGETIHVDFRIERHDPSGNRMAPVPAEMEGTTTYFRGRVSNGDEIRVVDGEWRDGTLRVTELDNLTTGASVRSSPPAPARLRAWAVLLTIVAAFVLLVKFSAPFWVFVIAFVIAFLVIVGFPASRRRRK